MQAIQSCNMDAVCCCFHVSDVDETDNSSSLNSGRCLCFNFCIQSLINKYVHLFGRAEMHPGPSSHQDAAYSTVSVNNSSDSNPLNDIPLPINASYRQSQVQMMLPDVEVTRPDSRSGQSRVESEPLGQSDTQEILPGGEGKLVGSGDMKQGHPESSVNALSGRVDNDIGYSCASSEDEDVCPTCLDEYTLENPKIIMKCSHHYHLSCIYEWMERSETCPFCGKLMLFDEKTGP